MFRVLAIVLSVLFTGTPDESAWDVASFGEALDLPECCRSGDYCSNCSSRGCPEGCAFGIPGVACAPSPTAHIYFVDQTGGFETLMYVDFFQSVGRVGRFGNVSMSVDRLAWHSTESAFYGVSFENQAWLRIDPTSGHGTTVGPFDVEVGQMTYNPIDGLIYAIDAAGTGLIAIQPATGEWKVAVSEIGRLEGLAFVDGFLGDRKGLLALDIERGLLLVRGSPPTVTRIGGGFRHAEGTRLFWDPGTRRLYTLGPSTLCCGLFAIRRFDASVGREDSEFQIFSPYVALPDFDALAAAIVPYQPLAKCSFTDADSDSDVDLRDFAEFENCMSGPN